MKERGFTLVELLVAITITVVMTGMVIVITTESLSFWNRTQSRTTTLAHAQLALDQLEYDLQGAIQRTVGEPWIRVLQSDATDTLKSRGWQIPNGVTVKPALNPNHFGAQPTLISESYFGRGGSWLRFFATDISSSGGLPVAVSYQINRRVAGNTDPDITPQSIRYMLMRSELPQSLSLAIMDSQIDSESILETPSAADVLALNVVDFGVWFYRRDGDGALERIPVNGIHPYVLPQFSAIPTEADVMVRVLSDKGATLISNIENRLLTQRPPEHASDAAWWWAVVEANSQVYVRRVNLINRPL